MEKDIILKEYEDDPAHFCDLINGVLAGGRPLVRPEQLQAMPTEVTLVRETEKEPGVAAVKTVQRFRDLTRKAMALDGEGYVILALQNQAAVDHGMALRGMMEDALEYDAQRRQLKNERLHSGEKLMGVFTVVLYHGADEWTAPTEMRELVRLPQEFEELGKYLQNYRLIFASAQTVDPEKFHTGWREIFEILKRQKDKTAMKEYLQANRERYMALPEDTNRLIFALTNQMEYYEEFKKKGEEPDMCKAFEDYRAEGKEEGRIEGIAEGREEGRLEGREEGRLEGRVEVLRMLFKNGVTLEQAASSVTFLSREELQKIYASVMEEDKILLG